MLDQFATQNLPKIDQNSMKNPSWSGLGRSRRVQDGQRRPNLEESPAKRALETPKMEKVELHAAQLGVRGLGSAVRRVPVGKPTIGIPDRLYNLFDTLCHHPRDGAAD